MNFTRFFMVSMVCLFGITHAVGADAAGAINGCGKARLTVSYTGNQQQTDDEFLYYGDYAYECDNEHCQNNTEITLPSGHIFMGQTINQEVTYKCSTGISDKWKIQTSGVTKPKRGYVEKACPAQIGTVRTAFSVQYGNDNEFIYSGNNVYECDDESGCAEGKKINVNAGHKFKGSIVNEQKCYICLTSGGDRWVETDCDGATTKSPSNNPKPDKNPDNMPEIEIDPVVITAPNPNKAPCEASGGVWSNGKCICDAAKNLKTVGKVCECINENYEFDTATKTCKMADSALEKGNCEKAGNDIAYWNGKECICRDTTKIWQQDRCVENPVIAACNAGSETQWNYVLGKCVCIESDKTMDANGRCVTTQTAGGTINLESQSRNKIKEAAQSAKGIADGFEKTVWKNEDGKFNTTRLASDSIAGVVLGTAGGLITSNVIKKNQIKNGFEDISCTVGGQVVAGWDDLFRVGIK